MAPLLHFPEILIGTNRSRRGAKSIGETLIELLRAGREAHKTNAEKKRRESRYLFALKRARLKYYEWWVSLGVS